METKTKAKFFIEDDRVQQIGGEGSDYGAWIRTERPGAQFILVQVGQCGNSPEGDAEARWIVEAMVTGLNESA